MGSDSFEWSTDVDPGTREGAKPYWPCRKRRLPGCHRHIVTNDSQSRIAKVRQQHHQVMLLERNPLNEDIVQAPVRLHPAIVGPTLLPGASIRDISPVDQGAPLILERTR